MSEERFETVSAADLVRVGGGMSSGQMPASARWIMQHESGGSTTSRNPHSTAFGAFQLIAANRRHYMGSNWQSTDLGTQYAAASRYVRDRYGSWDNAKAFWVRHRWY
jgi:hypothetical protein